MKSLAIILLTAAAFILSPVVQASAVTPNQPHDFTCAACHSPHKTLGSTGYDNICLSCHRGGDHRAGAKSFAPGDAADPFDRYTSGVANRFQISHRWDGSDTNVRAGAAPPVQASMTGVRSRTSGSLACVRCHNPHSQVNKPFLRMANDADQMCLDCHSSRNTTNQTKGTHPVGVAYPQVTTANSSAFNLPPVNANPANPTSAMKLPGGKVSCSSCHGVHTTDSNSSTFDSFSTLSDLKPSDGNLLRTDRRAATAAGINICTNCHAGKVAHNGRGQNIQCGDCHGAHVDEGDGSVPNVWLVKRDMGPGRGQVFFNSTTVKNYMSAGSTGVCQSCHAVPTDSGFQFHLTQTNATCNGCHLHGNSIGSFSADLSTSCNSCHGYPPVSDIAGGGGYAAGYQNAPSFTNESLSGHASHASAPYQKACESCHKGNSHQTGTFQDVFIVTTGTIAATGGLTPAYNTAGQTCSNVYCHSNANPRGGTSITTITPSWNGGKGTIIGTAGECGRCHSAAGAAAPTWSASHTRHVNGYAANVNFTCNVCHAGTASGNSAIFSNITARSMHTNGVKDVAFNAFANGGSWDQASAACSNLYCHSNVQGAAGVGAPTTFSPGLTWNAATMTCGSCHASMVKLANISSATGSHKRHVQGYAFDCSVCHGAGYSATGASVPVASHVDGTITIGFTGIAANNGTTPGYAQGSNNPGEGYAGCSAVYCHSNVQGSGGVGAPTKYFSPVWGAGPVTCGSCHVNMASSGAGAGSHVQHVITAGYSCPTCHNGAGKDPNPPFAATAKHADGTIELSFSGSGAGAIYSKGGSVTPGTGYGSCTNASCHADPYGPATVTTPVWGAVIASGCAACHNGGGAFGTDSAPATGSHGKHMARPGALCNQCHNGAVAGSSGGAAHGDGNIDVTNGYPANVAKHAAGTYTGACSTTCHSPTTAPVSTPTWGTASSCSSCHESTPTTGSHPLHSGLTVQALCISCHAGAVVDVNAGTSHLNGTIDVTNGYPANVAKHAPGSYAGTCATAAACHANPYGTSAIITPVWGVEAGNHCAGCHNGSGAFDAALGSPSTGSHAKHMALAGVLCNQCHAGAVKNSDGGSLHKNGNIDVTNGYPAIVAKHAAGTYTGTCSTAVCHGSGIVPWGGTLWSTTDQCGACHASNANGTVTQAAPFYNTAYPVKTTAATDAKVGAHTNHMSSQTLGVSASTACTDCHGAVTLSGATHMNGSTTFVWSALATKNGTLAPTYTAATGQCAATYCHGNSMPGGDTGGSNRSPVWNNPNYLPATISAAACGTCHGFPPSNAFGHPGGITIPAGFPATTSIGTTCSCHGNINTTGNSYATIFVNPALHINGILETPASGGHVFPYPGASHLSAAGVTPWSACTGCHNATATGVTYAAWASNGRGTAPNCTTCHIAGLKAPTGTSSCYDCHGASATDGKPNGGIGTGIGGSTFPNYSGSHTVHISKAGLTCDTCHSGAGTGALTHGNSNGVSKTAATVAFSGLVQPVWTSPNCTAACHVAARWGGRIGCVNCHSTAQAGTHGTPRDAVSTEFGLAWGHKKSGRGAVTDADCIVCHLEGEFASQAQSAKHADGNIDLRDPDGVGEVGITNISGTAFTFTKFATSFAAGSRTATGQTSNTDIANVLTQKFCLKCHDVNGATNATARSGAAPTQYLPFGTGSQNGAAYTVGLSAGVVGGVVNVDSMFATTNSTFHPVKGPQNNRYASGTRMAVPYGITKTAVADGIVMNCFDCHNAPTPLTSRTVAAHGSTAPNAYRGTVYDTTNTLCKVCHTGYTGTTSHHGAGSAFASNTNSGMTTYLTGQCQRCHASTNTAVRPVRAEDAHGFNRFAGTGTDALWPRGTTETYRPYAFMRNTTQWTTTSWKPLSGAGVPAGTATCGGNMTASGCGDNMTTYTPGGTYP